MAIIFLSMLAGTASAVNNIQFGVAQTGHIAAGEMQTYQFQASAGDVIYVKLTQTSGNIWPGAIIYSPAGNELENEHAPGNCEFTVNMTESGTFSLVVHDGFNGQYTGDYHLQLQKIPSPQNAKSLSFGTLKSSSIASAGAFDTYTFQGNANDMVHLKMTLSNGNLWPKVVIFSPTGKPVLTDHAPTSYETNVRLPETGTYTLIAEDGFNGQYTGQYTIMMNVVGTGNAGGAIATSGTQATPGATGSQAQVSPPGVDSSLFLIGGGLLLLVLAIIAIVFLFLRRGKKPKTVFINPPNPPASSSAGTFRPPGEKGVSHDVFISYSSDDKHIADAACARLEANKIRCWIAPRDILPGTNYAESILKAISSSLIFVMVFSSSADKSPHVMREVENAVNSAVPIITFRIDGTQPGAQMKYYIGPIHWLDAMTPPMEEHLDKLVQTVELLIKQSRPLVTPAIPAKEN